MGFYEYKCDDRVYLKSSLFSAGEVSHGFTSALGGVSRGAVKGFNLGFRVNDSEESVRKNYRLLECDLDIDLNRTVLAKQTHTDNIRIVTEDDCGKGIVRASDIEDTDGLVTNISGIALVVFSADCIPVLFYDPKNRVAAAVHSGWRGTVKKISARCIEVMSDVYGCSPKNILAAVGPSIGPCCFEFGSDAPRYFEKKYQTPKSNGKFMIDLWAMISDTIEEAGVLRGNIDISKVCTVCSGGKYYSYRCQKEHTGRQGAVIMLKG